MIAVDDFDLTHQLKGHTAMIVSNELNQWIKEHGNERDALNVALARLAAARFKLRALRNATLYTNCPS